MRRAAAVVAAGALLSVLLPTVAVGAGGYEMSTAVQYVVDVAASRIDVTVDVKFTNLTPNPPGGSSGFDHVDFALQPGASEVVARDARGPLTVGLVPRSDALVAAVSTRGRVRSGRSVTFALSYRLADGAGPELHVRPEVVKFPAWGYGTDSEVTIDLPAGYEVRVDGDPMVSDSGQQQIHLSSGAIGEPAQWLALLVASRPTDLVTRGASVALPSGTVDLQVRSWSGDAAWGEQTLATLERALPAIERLTGLPYPRVGPLVVSEVVGDETILGDAPSPTAELRVAFDADTFTLLHQAAQIWIGQPMASERWIREGLASHVAELIGSQLGAAGPYDPVQRAADLRSEAFPLASWETRDGAAADRYGYAASWAFVDEAAHAAGEEKLWEAMRRVVNGLSAYDPAQAGPVAGNGLPYAAVDARGLLDQLVATSGVDLAARFRDAVLGAAADVDLAARASARRSYAELLSRAGDWGAPDPVISEMAAWRFGDARADISRALSWLDGRDRLLAEAGAAGLSIPDRLRDRYREGGGGPDARAELAAERTVVDAYATIAERAGRAREPLAVIGLIGAEDPRTFVAAAAADFAMGDLQATADALDAAEVQLNRAPANGLVRIVSGAVLLVVIGLLLVITLRRRRGSHYTAAP